MTEHRDCLFCALVAGDTDASIVFNDDRVMAVMTIRPAHVGHVLLFPREHVEDFAVLDQAMLGYLFLVAARLKYAICNAVPCEGFQVLINQGEATGQKEDCRHLHLHLIPRSLNAPSDVDERPVQAPRAGLDETARAIAGWLSIRLKDLP